MARLLRLRSQLIHMEKLRRWQKILFWIIQRIHLMAVMIMRYFNVIGSDLEGILGEAPRPELCEHGRISCVASFDAARGIVPRLKTTAHMMAHVYMITLTSQT